MWLLPIFDVFTHCFFFNFANSAEGIWLSDNWCDVRLNLKRNKMLSSLTWKMLAQKNIKKQKKLVFRFIIFVKKNMICLYFSPVAKLWSRRKVLFENCIFWRYSETLKAFQSIYSVEISCQTTLAVLWFLKCIATAFVEPRICVFIHFQMKTLFWNA